MKFAVLCLLLVASYHDIKCRRIPNWLQVLGYGIALAGALSAGRDSVVEAIGGALVGLLAFLPFYLLKMLGAGDVKLLSVVGAFLGVKGVLASALFSVLWGGVVAIIYVLTGASRTLPYAMAILIGVSTYVIATFYRPDALMWITGG
jgi:prepilin peptidase CpaA